MTGVSGAPVSWEPGGQTRAFALLGHPVSHALSPAMHNEAFRALNMDAVYLAFDIPPGGVASAIRAMAACKFGGGNVTVPHKEEAFRSVDRLADSARMMGSVNTLQFTSDGIVGHNTDAAGFLRAVHEAWGESPEGRRIFVCGAGGAGRAVALVCASRGAAAVALSDTDSGRPKRVQEEIAHIAPDTRTRIFAAGSAEAAREAHASDWVVHATPLGMRAEDPSALPPSAFRAGQVAFDIVYVRPETAFMRTARQAGARAENGLGMLLWQGALAFQIWTGAEPPVDRMRAVLKKAVYA